MQEPSAPNVAPRSNGRTALVLLSIALAFFLGVIAKRFLMG